MAIPDINVLGNPNVTEGNFQIAIEDLRKSVIGSGKAYDSANTYSQYDTCVYNGVEYYSKINSNTGNTPAVNANWGLIGDLLNLLITNGTAFGYGTGSGGTVTQLTSKSTAVTLNKPSGRIIMNNSELVQNTKVAFLLYNSNISEYDNILITVVNGSTVLTQYEVRGRCAGGVAEIVLSHTYTGTLVDALVLTFTVIKGAIS